MNTSNFADGDPCPATAGKINTEFFSGLGAAQLRASQLPSAQLSAQLPAECVNDFATPCFMNLLCRVVLFQSVSFALVVG